MTRASRVGWVLVGSLLLSVTACQLPAEKLPVKPLPQDGQSLSYPDLWERARGQANAATEAFYLDSWAQLEESAVGLEQTARQLGQAADAPETVKPLLASRSDELTKLASQLRDTAKSKDVKHATEVMQRITLTVRELRATR